MNEYTDIEREFIKNNYNNMSASDIAGKLNRTKGSVQRQVQKMNLHKDHCSMTEWSDDEINYLKDNYEEKTYDEMSRFLNRTKKAIQVKAHKLGLKKSMIYYDKDKFHNIDNEQDAYWLGFLYADGYVIASKNKNHTPYFGVQLQKRDEEHLRKLNKFMNGNATIYHVPKKSPCSDNYYEQSSISFSGSQLVNNLIENGCVPRKSTIIQFPYNISNELYRHFIRGYFDGDGSVGAYGKYKYIRASIECASYDFLTSIKNILNENDITCGISKDYNAWKLYIGGMKNTNKFLNYLYKDSSIYLDRKYYKYIKLTCPNMQ